ncbi:MAG: O-antigen ligase family protein [Aquisalinus sp.]|nr:O-antigen ligase family protein [Aquisalinus sp.]
MTGPLSSGTWRQRIPVGTVLVLLAALPILLLFSHRNTVTALALISLATLVYPGALSTLRSLLSLQALLRPSPASVLLWLLILCAYMGLSIFWSSLPERAEWAPRMAAFILSISALVWLATRMTVTSVRRAVWIFIIITILTALFLGFEGLSGGLLRDLLPKDGIKGKDLIASARGTGLALYLAPVCILALATLPLVRNKTGQAGHLFFMALIIIGLAIASLLLGGVSANLLALAGGLTVAFSGYFLSRTALSLAHFVSVGLFLFWALVALLLPAQDTLVSADMIPTSWQMRLIAWQYSFDLLTSDLWTFLFGGGIGFSRFIYETGPTVQLAVAPSTFNVMPTHPHNLFIQIWLEFGLVGVVLLVAAITQLFRHLASVAFTRMETAALCALIAVSIVFASVETSLWTVWRFSTLGFAIFGLLLIRRLARLES